VLFRSDISQEVSNVAATTTSTINSPTIKQRKIDSTVAVRDNETIALGGLISDSTSSARSGLPILSRIPVLGGIFGAQGNNVTKTELIVLITPHVVNSSQKARRATEEFRRRLTTVQPLFEKEP
jgi:general secretion pathway protein D